MGRCCATESGRSSAIRGKSIPLTIRDSSFPCRGSTSASHPAAHAGAVSGGASSRGKQFAAGHAECVFVAAPSKVLLKKTVADIRRRAAEAGRDPHSILIFNLQTVIVGDTDREAQAKWQEYKQYVSYEGALALLSGWTGIDFGQYQPDQVLKYLHTNAIQSAVEAFSTADPNRQWTVQARPIGRGSAASVRWWLAARKPWRTNCSPGSKRRTSMALTSPMPSLTKPSATSSSCWCLSCKSAASLSRSTARDPARKLFGAGPRLAAPHPGASYRRDARTAASVEEKVT